VYNKFFFWWIIKCMTKIITHDRLKGNLYHSMTKLFKIFQKCTTGFLIVYSEIIFPLFFFFRNGLELQTGL
jgi:hypothetical protein